MVNRESIPVSFDKIFELAASLQAQGEHLGKFIIILSGSSDKDDRPNFFKGLQIIRLLFDFFFIGSFLPSSLLDLSKPHRNSSFNIVDFSLLACVSCSSHLLPFAIISLVEIFVEYCLLFSVHCDPSVDSILLLSLDVLENDDVDFSAIVFCRQSSTCMSTKVV